MGELSLNDGAKVVFQVKIGTLLAQKFYSGSIFVSLK